MSDSTDDFWHHHILLAITSYSSQALYLINQSLFQRIWKKVC